MLNPVIIIPLIDFGQFFHCICADLVSPLRFKLCHKKFGGRVTFVLSMLFGLFGGIVNGDIHDSGDAFAAGFLVPFGLTWLVYFAVGFVIRGFASKR